MTFAIVTLTLLFVIQQLAFNLRSLTNGSLGLVLPSPHFPISTYERPFYFAMLGVLVLGLAMCWWMRGSKLGLMLFAIREDEDKARGLGVRDTCAKLDRLRALGRAHRDGRGVWAYYLAFIYPQFAVDPLVTIGMVLMTFLGGRGTLWGPVLGAFMLVPAQQYLAYRLGASELYSSATQPSSWSSCCCCRAASCRRWPSSARGCATRRRRRRARPSGGGRDAVTRPARGRRADKRFGGVVAVDECSFSVAEGTITALIGPNGRARRPSST